MIMSATFTQEDNPQQRQFTKGQSWGALRKLWRGYKVAKVQNDEAKMKEYAEKIRKVQGELGIAVATFPHLGLD